MIYDLGPRARRVYNALREQIRVGELPQGGQIPSLNQLASTYGVAVLTVRHVVSQLEAEGLVVREQGRGTFVRAPNAPAVLVVDDDPEVRQIIGRYVADAGFRVIEAGGPDEALAAVARERELGLVLTDVRMPSTEDGVGFIRHVRRAWPDLPLAVISGYTADIGDLQDTPDCPVMILAKPVRREQVAEAVRLAARSRPVGRPPRAAALVVGDEAICGALRPHLVAQSYAVEEAGDGPTAAQAVERRRFSHAFLDPRAPGAADVALTLTRDAPQTVLVVVGEHAEATAALGAGPYMVLPTPTGAGVASALRLRLAPEAVAAARRG